MKTHIFCHEILLIEQSFSKKKKSNKAYKTIVIPANTKAKKNKDSLDFKCHSGGNKIFWSQHVVSVGGIFISLHWLQLQGAVFAP